MSDKKSGRKKICISCGGSAGHIFPGLTLAKELARLYGDNVEISFFTSDNKLGQMLLKKSGFDFYALPPSLFKSFLRSMSIILTNRPDCFVGFGAYVSGPPFIAASLSRLPTLIHEQNAVMGKANRIMRGFATRVALSFPEETHMMRKNVVITGNPIRESASKIQRRDIAIDFLGLRQDRFTILVIGGSQGSRKINSVTIKMFKNMDSALKNKLQVIHISGENDYEGLKKAYHDTDLLYRLYPFFEDMSPIYNTADISISRAGASTIFELCTHRIPSILIPYPFAEGHQRHNASYLAEREAALMLEEDELSESSLKSAMVKLMGEKELRKSMAEKMAKLTNPDAARRLAEEVGSLARLDKNEG